MSVIIWCVCFIMISLSSTESGTDENKVHFILGKVGLFHINKEKEKEKENTLSFVNWNGSEIVGVYVLVLKNS